jgi:hypothetical protein
METPVTSPLVEGGLIAHAPTSTPQPDAPSSAWKASLRELLRWCLPALILGLALRAALTWSMPYGYVQYDTSDYLTTVYHIIDKHEFYIHNKRSYLTPTLFAAAWLLPVPATITIAAAQHVMGLIATVIVGALVRLWFRFWRVAIIPVTVLFTSNPSVLWYEHTLMGEAQFLFFTLLLVLAGTLFALRPTTKRLIWFVVSMLLVFGTRLESKTYILFVFALVVLVLWKQWKRLAIGIAAVLAAYFAAFHVSGDRDVSSLVYASIIRFAPTTSASTPDIMPQMNQIRERARKGSVDYPTKTVRISKLINHTVDAYAAQRVQGKRKQAAEESRIVRSLCVETLKAEPVKVLVEPWLKFRLAIDAWSSYCWDRKSLLERQRDAFLGKEWMTTVLSRGLTGKTLTLEQISEWVKEHHSAERIAWFTRYQRNWNKQLIHFRTADQPMDERRWVHDFFGGVGKWLYTFPGLPYFYILGFVGMFAAVLRPPQLRAVHFAWVATVLGGLYVCSMVGVTNGRFRFVYEPFFLLYFFFLFDCVADFWKDLRDRRVTSRACST